MYVMILVLSRFEKKKKKFSPALNMENKSTLQSVFGKFERDVLREISNSEICDVFVLS